jgi:hypothetical protein
MMRTCRARTSTIARLLSEAGTARTGYGAADASYGVTGVTLLCVNAQEEELLLYHSMRS